MADDYGGGAGAGSSNKRAKLTDKPTSSDRPAELEPGRHAGHLRPSRQAWRTFMLCVCAKDGGLLSRYPLSFALPNFQEFCFDRLVVSSGIPEAEGVDFSPGGAIDFLRKEAGGNLVESGKGLISVERSSNRWDNARNALGIKGVECSTWMNEPNSWWRFDLKRHQVRGDIQRYTLRHGFNVSHFSLRRWRLEGSAEGGKDGSWLAIDIYHSMVLS